MTARRKRESAQERDERIVAQHRWCSDYCSVVAPCDWPEDISDKDAREVVDAAARILNRLSKRRGK